MGDKNVDEKEEARLNGYFDLSKIYYAIIETLGYKNGAYIADEDEKHYLMRIKK